MGPQHYVEGKTYVAFRSGLTADSAAGHHIWNNATLGMKAHIGVAGASGLVHSVIGTAANVNDVTQAGALLHGVWIVVLTSLRPEAAALCGCRFHAAADEWHNERTVTEIGNLSVALKAAHAARQSQEC